MPNSKSAQPLSRVVRAAMSNYWPPETPNYWEEVSQIVDANPPSDSFKTDWVAKRVPLYSKKMTSFDVVYLADVMEYFGQQSAKHVFRDALREPFIGHTPDTYAESVFSPSKELDKISVWTVKSLHHWIALEKLTTAGKMNSYDHIIEVGAGIGETARILFDAFDYSGKYTIVDLPAIAQFSKKNLKGYPVDFADGINVKGHGRTLVVSTWGLSETPLDFREQLLDNIGECDLFVAFQSKIFDLDNREYFIRHYPTRYNKNIRISNIQNHTIDGGNFYLFAD
jgi:hypothetical protein